MRIRQLWRELVQIDPVHLAVEKFPAQNDQYLVAYEIDDKNRIVTFLDIGQHEHSYRDLEKYRKTAL